MKNDTPYLYDTAVQMLKQLIAIPSVSKEEHGTAHYIHSFLQSQDIVAHRLVNNIWATNKYYDKRKPTLLLNSHHDTVKPNPSYTNNPFVPVEVDGKLYGLGSNDAGGCLVSLLSTFLHFYDKQNLSHNIVFAATAEEEISGMNGIEALLPKLGKIDWAIVGEPTLMQMAIAEKGLMVLDCTVKGKSGHVAHDEGDNAIYKCMKDILWFKEYSFPKVSDTLGTVKMSVTTIDAGTQHNVIPDTCQFTVDVRINDCYTHQEIIDIIHHNTNCEIVPRSTRLRSTAISAEHPVVLGGIGLGKQIFGSSTLSDKALMPFPALKMGPGDSTRSHTADEYIYTEEIKQGIVTYIELLNAVI
jgi:Acetylornithine deacetylase/Succinyl-diaminopimelate desuccinylase and related deacylases